MSSRRNFTRKIVYLTAIAILLVPIALLGQPSAGQRTAGGERSGGKLAQLRDNYGLSQSALGQIDPTSEALKLATLGMRGVAANILWGKAHNYQKEEDWTRLSATCEQIAKLQPNFVAAWRYQCWNLAYNVSAQWDDSRDRYFWVIRGVNFLKEGVRYNEYEPKLRREMGWTIAQKIGRADEREVFRELFREDDEFHGDRPESQRDNWLVGKEYFLQGQNLVDQGYALTGFNPVIFHSEPPMTQMNYAAALEGDGVFGKRAIDAWNEAAEEWQEYGQREIPTSQKVDLRLAELDFMVARYQETIRELNELDPGVAPQIYEHRYNTLTAEQQALLERPTESLNFQERAERAGIQNYLAEVDLQLWAEAMPADRQEAAKELAQRAMAQRIELEAVANYRNEVNYDYWQRRAIMERDPLTMQARETVYQGKQAYEVTADLEVARQKYEDGWQQWRNVFDRYPAMREDHIVGEDLLDSVDQYAEILRQLDEPFPADFILQDIKNLHRPEYTDEQIQDALQGRPTNDTPAASEEPAATAPVTEEAPADEPAAVDEPAAEEPVTEEPMSAEAATTEEPATAPAATEEEATTGDSEAAAPETPAESGDSNSEAGDSNSESSGDRAPGDDSTAASDEAV